MQCDEQKGASLGCVYSATPILLRPTGLRRTRRSYPNRAMEKRNTTICRLNRIRLNKPYYLGDDPPCFILNEMRFLVGSTPRTVTVTCCCRRTTSAGSLTNRSASSLM